MGDIQRQLMRHLLFIPAFLFVSCSAPEAQVKEQETLTPTEIIDEKPLTEELPDSGILKSVNPELIITDDWSDDGDLELEIEDK